MPNQSAILVAEPILVDAAHVQRCLRQLGYLVRVATSAHQALAAMRRELMTRAVVAAELAIGPEPLLERLSRLPAMVLLVATGPCGAPQVEVRARRAGAQVYLPRPVDFAALATALQVSRAHEALAKPP